jgi:hypothetical protein
MLGFALARLGRLLLILALLVAGHMSAAPMPAANPASPMTGMAGDSNGDPCKGCAPAQQAVIDCSAMCVPLVAVVQPAPAASRIAHGSSWTWSDDPVVSSGIEPDTGPPRI